MWAQLTIMAVDILSPTMTLREQGYVGDCRVGLYRQFEMDASSTPIEHFGLYIQVILVTHSKERFDLLCLYRNSCHFLRGTCGERAEEE